MANKYFDKFGNSIFPEKYDKADRTEAVLEQKVIKEKISQSRPKPSDKLINNGPSLVSAKRAQIIDLAGKLYDEEMLGGRMALCLQFAILLRKN